VFVRQVDRVPPKLRWLRISERSTDVVIDGKLVGSWLRNILVNRFSPYLWFVGCGLVDSSSAWVCTTSSFFEGQSEVIGSDPASAGDNDPSSNAIGILLGIPKYTTDDLLHFAGYSANAAIVSLAQSPEPTSSPVRHR
jgi:hypothetical protein